MLGSAKQLLIIRDKGRVKIEATDVIGLVAAFGTHSDLNITYEHEALLVHQLDQSERVSVRVRVCFVVLKALAFVGEYLELLDLRLLASQACRSKFRKKGDILSRRSLGQTG